MKKKLTNLLAVTALLLMSSSAFAGIDFGSTENGSSRPSWGRAAGASWGMSGFLVETVKLKGMCQGVRRIYIYIYIWRFHPFSGGLR